MCILGVPPAGARLSCQVAWPVRMQRRSRTWGLPGPIVWEDGPRSARVRARDSSSRRPQDPMKHSVSHDLGKEKARAVAEAAFESYQQKFAKYGPKATWAADSHADIQFTVKGVTLQGALAVTDRTIDMELSVPFLFRPFQGVALRMIEQEINEWLAKARAGEI